jgi:glycosyltransferase involved in cell wall biosynthesis
MVVAIGSPSAVKILYTTVTSSAQSGATHQLFVMAEMAREMGFTPIIALPAGGRPETNVPVFTVDMSAPRLVRSVGYQARYFGGFIPTIAKMAKLMRSEKVDLVHANEIVDLQPAYAAKLAKKPLVWAIRAGFSTTPRLTRIFSKIAVSNAQKIVPVSRSVQENFFGWYANHDRKIEVLYDAPRFVDRADPTVSVAWREKLGLSPSSKLIVQVSKLLPQKGHAVLVEAAPEILARYGDCRILIVGGEAEGRHEYAVGLQTRIAQLGIGDHVTLFGASGDVPGLMAASDVVVHCPVFKDPLPGVVIEGMIAARPVVGTRIGGVPEEIEEGITGLLANPNDPRDLAAKILTVLDLPLGEQEAMGERGRERALTIFSRQQYIDGLRRIYGEATGSS